MIDKQSFKETNICVSVFPADIRHRSMRIYTAVSLLQDEFRTNHFYILPVTILAFCIYAQNAVRPCSCGHQGSNTHTHTPEHYYNPPPMRSG